MKTKLFSVIAIIMTLALGFSACKKDEEDPTYKLTLLANPDDGGTRTGGGDFKEGAKVALSATASDGFTFVNWTDAANEVVSTNAAFEYTMPAKDITLTANFEVVILVNTAKLGAQANTSFGGFLSISEKTVYTQEQAFQNQDKIDILCFFEEEGGNNIALAAPGSNITGIFSGDSAPENWIVKNQTYFTLPTSEVSVEQFDALVDGDPNIETYFNAEQTSGNRKAKDMKVNDIWTFKTVANTFGILKVISVEQGEAGFVEFEYKLSN